MVITYCDDCGVLVRHPKAEVQVYCPKCHAKHRNDRIAEAAKPIPCAERMIKPEAERIGYRPTTGTQRATRRTTTAMFGLL